VLKALGASSRGVMSIFLSYGLSLGAVAPAWEWCWTAIVANHQPHRGGHRADHRARVFDQRLLLPEDSTIVDPSTVAGVVIGSMNHRRSRQRAPRPAGSAAAPCGGPAV